MLLLVFVLVAGWSFVNITNTIKNWQTDDNNKDGKGELGNDADENWLLGPDEAHAAAPECGSNT